MPFPPYPPMGLGPTPAPAPGAAPQAIQGLQSPYAPAPESQLPPALLAQLLALHGPSSDAEAAAADAAAEEHRTPSMAAHGEGPGGIRIGEGPGGWAVSLGDLVGSMVQTSKNREAKDEARRAHAELEAQAKGPLMDLLDVYRGKKKKSEETQVHQGSPMTAIIPTPRGDGGPMGL